MKKEIIKKLSKKEIKERIRTLESLEEKNPNKYRQKNLKQLKKRLKSK